MLCKVQVHIIHKSHMVIAGWSKWISGGILVGDDLYKNPSLLLVPRISPPSILFAPTQTKTFHLAYKRVFTVL